MSELHPQLAAELEKANVALFGAMLVEFPDRDMCLLDGAGSLLIGNRWFAGRDDVYGVCSGISEFSDGDPTQAPHLTLTFQPPTNTAAAALTSALNQGSPTTLMLGAIDRTTGLVIPNPYELFVGEWDVATINIDKSERSVDVEIVSIFERLFEQDEGVRLTSSWLQSVWPNHKGLDFHTADPTNLPWGKEGSRAVAGGASSYVVSDAQKAILRRVGASIL